VTTSYVVAKQPLKFGPHDVRLPGQLVPEAADWTSKIRQIHLDLGWLKEVNLATDADRQVYAQRWQEEQEAREQARKQAEAQQAAQVKEEAAQPPRRVFKMQLFCANCHVINYFEEVMSDLYKFNCGNCGQRQMVMQAKNGTLHHNLAANRAASMWQYRTVRLHPGSPDEPWDQQADRWSQELILQPHLA
jgi:hypothetical protein